MQSGLGDKLGLIFWLVLLIFIGVYGIVTTGSIIGEWIWKMIN